eukprot:TRINITY_DN26115_c0_g1_i2.p1 TRINITY_DN26115_c0_g1~~TRINITY_DN26115_c0_g1_i2.p1  ORF type:complete len:474 (-),score=99.02 TRINITY_DN26115_c0_g1_i2:102-1523(-)
MTDPDLPEPGGCELCEFSTPRSHIELDTPRNQRRESARDDTSGHRPSEQSGVQCHGQRELSRLPNSVQLPESASEGLLPWALLSPLELQGVHTDDAFIIQEYQDEVYNLDRNPCSTIRFTCAPFAVSWVAMVCYLAVDPNPGSSSTNYAILEFVLFPAWAFACSLNSVTFLDAVAPIPTWILWAIVLVGTLTATLFWLARFGVTGYLSYSKSKGKYWDVNVILIAVVVPIFVWVCSAARYQVRVDPALQRISTDSTRTNPQSGQLLTPVCYYSWRTQRVLGATVLLFNCTVYATLGAFLHSIEDRSLNRFKSLGWYTLFVIVCQLFKTCGKRLGVAVDQGKFGTFSMYFALEFLVTLFYYTFYRSLFDKIEDTWIFVLVQVLHLTHEWVVFPFKASETCYEVYTYLDQWLQGGITQQIIRNVMLAPGVRCHRDLQCAVTMELALRMLSSLFSALVFLTPVSYTHLTLPTKRIV